MIIPRAAQEGPANRDLLVGLIPFYADAVAGIKLNNRLSSWHVGNVDPTNEKYQRLKERLNEMGSCLVAYSGGVDSVFLAVVAHQTLGDRSLAVIADSPSLPRQELKEALEFAERFGFPVEVIRTREFDNENYLKNPVNRCYFCKSALFEEMEVMVQKTGIHHVVYGENASDVGDYRPGAQAAREYSVEAPMKLVGLTKSEIRELSAQLGLPTADKPQMACLSSRIPYGESVTTEKLSEIEQAERVLKDRWGLQEVRVRSHEMQQGRMARIEFGALEWDRFCSNPLWGAEINAALCEIGFRFVTMDLAGYRRGGGLNDVVKQTTSPAEE